MVLWVNLPSGKKEGDVMQSLIDFILSGSAEFTPETLVRYMCFVLVHSCIGSVVNSVFDNLVSRR